LIVAIGNGQRGRDRRSPQLCSVASIIGTEKQRSVHVDQVPGVGAAAGIDVDHAIGAHRRPIRPPQFPIPTGIRRSKVNDAVDLGEVGWLGRSRTGGDVLDHSHP